MRLKQLKESFLIGENLMCYLCEKLGSDDEFVIVTSGVASASAQDRYLYLVTTQRRLPEVDKLCKDQGKEIKEGEFAYLVYGNSISKDKQADGQDNEPEYEYQLYTGQGLEEVDKKHLYATQLLNHHPSVSRKLKDVLIEDDALTMYFYEEIGKTYKGIDTNQGIGEKYISVHFHSNESL